MEAALKGRAACPEAAGFLAGGEAVELDGVLWDADEFSVDDLLDFAGAPENCSAAGDEDGADEEEEFAGHEDAENDSGDSPVTPPPSEIVLPAIIDAAELEWVSRVMDDSSDAAELFRPSSGVVLVPKPATSTDTASGSGAGNLSRCLFAGTLAPAKAKRSKRARTAGWVRSSGHLSPAARSLSSSPSSSSASAASSPYLVFDFPLAIQSPEILLLDDLEMMPKPEKKKRGRKPKLVAGAGAGAGEQRRCSHCGSQRTPQWRAGPMGAKTLCNACGVRFKSGRLLPEYRPACSPSFVSDVHSNSHRKVLEMRSRKETEEEEEHQQQQRRLAGAGAGGCFFLKRSSSDDGEDFFFS